MARLINPAKNEIRRISKVILESINKELRKKLQLQQWNNGYSTMIYIFLMIALLLELVASPVMIAPPTSPSVGATGQQKHTRD